MNFGLASSVKLMDVLCVYAFQCSHSVVVLFSVNIDGARENQTMARQHESMTDDSIVGTNVDNLIFQDGCANLGNAAAARKDTTTRVNKSKYSGTFAYVRVMPTNIIGIFKKTIPSAPHQMLTRK